MIEILPNWHPLFVHFSIALLTVSVVLFVLSKLITNWRMEDQLLATAYWNLWIAAAISVGTVIAGWFAFNSVDHDTPSHVVMLEHRTWAFATFGAMIVMAIWAALQYRAQKAPSWLFLISLLVAQTLILGTAWHGGELVYRHGLGVKRLPDPDEHKHAAGVAPHAHDAGVAADHPHGKAVDGVSHHDEMAVDEHSHAPTVPGVSDMGTDHHADGVVAPDGHHHAEDAVPPVTDAIVDDHHGSGAAPGGDGHPHAEPPAAPGSHTGEHAH